MSEERRPLVELVATIAGAAVIAYLTDPDIRRGVNSIVGGFRYRYRLLRWWGALAGWQQEDHNQQHGRDPLLQPERIRRPRWWGRFGDAPE
jgi:hypothetical protein